MLNNAYINPQAIIPPKIILAIYNIHFRIKRRLFVVIVYYVESLYGKILYLNILNSFCNWLLLLCFRIKRNKKSKIL